MMFSFSQLILNAFLLLLLVDLSSHHLRRITHVVDVVVGNPGFLIFHQRFVILIFSFSQNLLLRTADKVLFECFHFKKISPPLLLVENDHVAFFFS